MLLLSSHEHGLREVPEGGGARGSSFYSVSSGNSKSRTGGMEQAKGAPATHTAKIHSPLPPPRLHQERRTEEVGEYLLLE